jgi:hypothetical protein
MGGKNGQCHQPEEHGSSRTQTPHTIEDIGICLWSHKTKQKTALQFTFPFAKTGGKNWTQFDANVCPVDTMIGF